MKNMTVETKNFPQGRFSERDLSWLSFNERVLDLAQDPNIPILERARFLAIFVSNLDEFFKVRIAGSKRRIEAGIAVKSAGGMLPRELLAAVLSESYRLQKKHSEIFEKVVRPLLADKDIRIIRWNELTEDEKKSLGTLFIEKIFPVLTPLAVDPAHPFPYISGLSLNLAVVINNPKNDTELFARVKVPPTFPRLINSQGQRFVPLEDVISAHLDLLFPGMEIVQHHTFRVTRNEDVEVEEVIDEHVLELLVEELEASENEVFRLPGLLDLRGLNDICNINRDDLKFAKFIPRTNPQLATIESASAPDVFEALKTRDILLHHPYDSFSTSVQRFLEQASTDPKVLAIKQTLYRTSGDSPIVSSLIEAAHNGKQVLAIVEIKARFDEEANISWAKKLEEAGVHVVYGVVGLKTHAKLSLVIRQENDRIKRYGHLGTGNYHPKTARGYEDLGLLTANSQITNDIAYLFNLLSGYSTNNEYDKLLVAPHSVRDGIIKRIKREIDNNKSGKPSGIRFKCNSLIDEQTIDALYEASSYGIKVDLVIRGMCALKPGVPGLSENITVRSILGRFLEHSRIYEFTNGGSKEVWIGSADLMHRNLDRRVEALVQLEDKEHVSYLSDLLDLYLNSETAHWLLDKNGSWMKKSLDTFGNPLQDAQEQLIRRKNLRGLD